jgi:hypothetical protein
MPNCFLDAKALRIFLLRIFFADLVSAHCLSPDLPNLFLVAFFSIVILERAPGFSFIILKNSPLGALGFRLAASPLFPLKWPLPYLQTFSACELGSFLSTSKTIAPAE